MILQTERTHTSCSHKPIKISSTHQLFLRTNYRPVTRIPLNLLERPQTELFHPSVNKRKKAPPSAKSSTLVLSLKENAPLMSDRTTKENKIYKLDEFLTVCSDITNRSGELGKFSKHFEEYGRPIISQQCQQL